MKFSALALQATLVLGVTATVGYPEFRQPARPVVLWRTAGPLTPRPDLIERDRRIAYGVSGSFGGTLTDDADDRFAGTAAQERQGIRAANLTRRTATISGRARTSLNQPVPFATLLLRSLRTGRIESRTRADQQGRFEFDALASGSYVVELVGVDGAVIAASEALAGGTANDSVVRVSANATPRALFGTTTGTTTATTTGTSAIGGNADGGSVYLGSSAGEPLRRAADTGVRQTTQPDEEASPRN